MRVLLIALLAAISYAQTEEASKETRFLKWGDMYEDLLICANWDQTCIADCSVDAPKICVDMKTALGKCAHDCDDCVKSNLKRSLGCREETVQMDFKLCGVTNENFKSMEKALIMSFAKALSVNSELLTLWIKQARLRRLLADMTITAFFETDDADKLTEELNAQDRDELMFVFYTEMSAKGFYEVNITDIAKAETFSGLSDEDEVIVQNAREVLFLILFGITLFSLPFLIATRCCTKKDPYGRRSC